MEILIAVKDKTIRLALRDNGREVDYAPIADERNLAEKLLPQIDRLLKRNNLAVKDVKKVRVESDQGETFTTTRIAETVAEVWKMAGS